MKNISKLSFNATEPFEMRFEGNLSGIILYKKLGLH
jgi:hypothetical protein